MFVLSLIYYNEKNTSKIHDKIDIPQYDLLKHNELNIKLKNGEKCPSRKHEDCINNNCGLDGSGTYVCCPTGLSRI